MVRTTVAFLTVASVFTFPATTEAQDKSIDRPTMGFDVVALRDVRDTIFKGTSPPTRTGAVIFRVAEFSPAADGKLKVGDIITRFNKKTIKTREELVAAKKTVSVGDVVEIRVHRAFRGKSRKKKVIWKRGEFKLKVVSFGDYVKNQIEEEVDDVTGTAFYKHKGSTKFVNERSELYIYYVKSKGKPPTLRLKIIYVADDWLFIKKYIIKAGDKTFTISTDSAEVERDLGNGKIWEWFSVDVGAKEREMLKALTRAKSITLRYEGKQYRKDREIEETEKNRVTSVLTAFKLSGGKW